MKDQIIKIKNQGIKIILPKDIFNASYDEKFRKPFESSLADALQPESIETESKIILSQAPIGESENLQPDIPKISREESPPTSGEKKKL